MPTRPRTQRLHTLWVISVLWPLGTTGTSKAPPPPRPVRFIRLLLVLSIIIPFWKIEGAVCDVVVTAIQQTALPDWFSLCVIAAVVFHAAILLRRVVHKS